MSASIQETITCEEFDLRLIQSTEHMRLKRLDLEARASELEDLIGKYSSILERLEAESVEESNFTSEPRNDLRNLLNELAERTSSVAAAL